MAGLRWLRVGQREHYLAGSVTRFARRWWFLSPPAMGLALVAIAATVLTWWWWPAAAVVAVVVGAGPPGLGIRGSTSPLTWTARLRRLAMVVSLLVAAALTVGVMVTPLIAVLGVLLLPVVVDVGLGVLAPWERRAGRVWVDRAATALHTSGATVVAITGSYGKTTTKGYVAHLLSPQRRVLASPASFNNRMGLARAVNEHLSGGIDVFVAEMGTYGPGEIADLCTWIPPDVSVITAIGPVHLERFGSEDTIVEAKSEILAGQATAVLNVDDSRLAALADVHEAQRRVVRVGERGREVIIDDGVVRVDGRPLGEFPPTAHPTNVACAVGVVVALGIDPDSVRDRLATLPEPEHRRTLLTGTTGAAVIDDTFNSNPAGAESALALLGDIRGEGKSVVVTPGMVELGSRQVPENRAFGARAAQHADVLVVVGRTNRRALIAGAAGGRALVMTVPDRATAVSWVRDNLGPGDAVLYENDLPDHYP
jgi:UDP-N-acetylmuramoyl-tripeptide--D-alanyl-D-alanine ligase